MEWRVDKIERCALHAVNGSDTPIGLTLSSSELLDRALDRAIQQWLLPIGTSLGLSFFFFFSLASSSSLPLLLSSFPVRLWLHLPSCLRLLLVLPLHFRSVPILFLHSLLSLQFVES